MKSNAYNIYSILSPYNKGKASEHLIVTSKEYKAF